MSLWAILLGILIGFLIAIIYWSAIRDRTHCNLSHHHTAKHCMQCGKKLSPIRIRMDTTIPTRIKEVKTK